ncbi:ankyrin-1-like [Mizuhopecten yessoensis]|uniref:Ankyrin-3 n=1 Tax=Mizuhopecten yessoensis TaxID=6573 RepID=A0A210Q4X6_MIZYE|nr:ankyrin-1-like [Mizuhopecten yessoensis]OWF43800.1 Ankyrin-3 [Mizuhopecten yessoensis]
MASPADMDDTEGTNEKGEDDDEDDEDGGEKRKTEWTAESLQRLLADAITYKSSLKDMNVILRCGADVNGKVKKGLRPLHYAAFVNYVECVELLIEKGAVVNVTDDIGYTPLHLCARRGFVDTLRVLIDHGAVLNFCDSDEESVVEDSSKNLGYFTLEPLNMAIESGHVECVRLMLEKGAKPNKKYFMGYEVNLVSLDNLECLELLLKYGGDPNAFSRIGLTPLMKACTEGKYEATELLIKYGADVHIASPARFDHKTPIYYAIQGGNTAIIQSLLEHGASLLKIEDFKYAPLHMAVISDRKEVCELLLEWRAEIDVRSDDRGTPLMLSCATPGLKERKSIIEILLKHGANVNAHSPYVSYTDPCLSPLSEYIKNNRYDINFDVIHLLIRYGAKVTFQADMTVFRLKDPFGILNYIMNVEAEKDIFMFLIEAASAYDLSDIRSADLLLASDKRLLKKLAAKPRDLKHLVRLVIRDHFPDHLPEKVQELPIPNLIKSYLLFDV